MSGREQSSRVVWSGWGHRSRLWFCTCRPTTDGALAASKLGEERDDSMIAERAALLKWKDAYVFMFWQLHKLSRDPVFSGGDKKYVRIVVGTDCDRGDRSIKNTSQIGQSDRV